MTEKDFIKTQEELIDKLLIQDEKRNKNNLIKDFILIGTVGLVIIVFFVGYWFSDTNYDNYINSNNSQSTVDFNTEGTDN